MKWVGTPIDINQVTRNVLANKPKVTTFSIEWDGDAAAASSVDGGGVDPAYASVQAIADATVAGGGDGSNTHLPDVAAERDAAVAAGITINGLPILSREEDIENYYRDRVIGGSNAFTEVAVDYQSFPSAMLRKLLREIRSDSLVSVLEPD